MDKIDLSPDQKIYFRDQLRNARNEAIKDAEGFTELLFVFERLGSFLTKNMDGLGAYKTAITDLVTDPKLVKAVPEEWIAFHSHFDKLYDMVKDGRNSALHQGAYARHLTQHAVELSIILENALIKDFDMVSDFMVRDPSCAYLWQPISFIRQTMLSNSFSYMPVCEKEGEKETWKLVADYEVARYLRNVDSKGNYRKHLATSLEDALKTDAKPNGIKLISTESLQSGQSVAEALEIIQKSANHPGLPILIFSEEDGDKLVGILTPFDLL